MGKVDLHIHSCISDGKYTPAEFVQKAAEAGLLVMALTDHDNVDGIPQALQAARRFPSLMVIPGVEISTEEPDMEVHVLGYFIDYKNPELLAALEKSRDSRVQRAKGMVERLAVLGMPVEWKRVQEIAGEGSIGRPHIAQAMLEKGYIATVREAFEKYIALGGPAYVERIKTTPAEAVRLILRAGGLPVLAHPLTGLPIRPEGETVTHGAAPREPEALIARLKESGLVGIEAHFKYNPEQIRALCALANKYGLICTGGTDYHGLDENVETPMGGTNVPLSAAEKLIALAQLRAKPPVC